MNGSIVQRIARRLRIRPGAHWALALASVYVACATTGSQVGGLLSNPARRPGVPVVAVLAPNVDRVNPLVRALRSELALDFDVRTTPVPQRDGETTIQETLRHEAPVAVVLVDNRTAATYATLARGQDGLPPAVLVMASFVEHLQATVPNSTAITFEPPAVVTLAHLRTLLRRGVARAGVVYRDGFEAFIERERQAAKAEHIELIAERVPARPSPSALGRALLRLQRRAVDALWVANDNVLLTRAMLSHAWLPFAERADVPIVVGVPALVSSGVPFGTYAAVPDLEGLGLQTAELIYELRERQWRAASVPVQPAYSTRTYLNLAQARTFGVSADAESRVDVLVEN